MEATWIGIRMWAQAVMQAGSTNVDAVRQALANQSIQAPSGFVSLMDAKNHHLHKPVFIGEIMGNGQFQIVWKTNGPIRAEPWSKFVPESSKRVADWTYPWSCGNCVQPRFAMKTGTTNSF
jgi:urea transport system substrate-binding protein